MINQETISALTTKAFELTATYLPKVILAVIVLYIGMKLAKYISHLIEKGLDKKVLTQV